MHFESYSVSEAHISAGCKCVSSILMQGEPGLGGRTEKGIEIRKGSRSARHRKKIINVSCLQDPFR